MTYSPLADTSIFTHPSFRQALAEEFHLVEKRLYANSHSEVEIPAFTKQFLFKKPQLIVGAGFDKTGDTEALSVDTFHTAIEELIHNPDIASYSNIEIRTKHCLPGHHDHSDKVELRVKLTTDTEEQWAKLSRNTRRNIRRTQKMGFRYEVLNNTQALDIFYELYTKSIHSLGSLPHKKAFFEKLLTHCPDHISIFIGYLENKPVVASLNFISQEEIYGAWSGFEPDMKKHNIFLAMLWGITEYGIEKQYSVYNLGRSSLDSSQYQFKKKIANTEQKIYYYQLKPQAPKKAGSLRHSASRILQRLPFPLLQFIANRFIHRFY